MEIIRTMTIKVQLSNGKLWTIGEIEDPKDINKIEEILDKNPYDLITLMPIFLKREDSFKADYIEPSSIKAIILQEGNVLKFWSL